MTGKADLGASVLARLLNRAKATGDDYQTLLTAYCFERFLYRLGASPLRDRFVLKGAMLLRLWSDQIDMGLGDAVWPEPQWCAYPALLDFPAPEVLAYPRETVVAEKLEAMVVLGDRNSRIKDFFDLHYLASRFAFDRAPLTEAVRRTFERRHTPILASDPIGLTPAYWENPSRPAQVRAFARRARLAIPEDPGREFVALLGGFLLPLLEDLRSGAQREGTWPPGGPWQ